MQTEQESRFTTEPGSKAYMDTIEDIRRERTSSHNPQNSQSSQFAKAILTNNPEELQNGYRYEVLFLACLKHHSPFVDIKVSNYNGDCHGVDFLIDHIPVDVTVNLTPKKMIYDAYRKKNYYTIFIPLRESFGNPFIEFFDYSKRDETLYYEQFINGEIDIKQFFAHTYNTNMRMLNSILYTKKLLSCSANEIDTRSPRYLKSIKHKLEEEQLNVISETHPSVFKDKIKEINRIFRIIDPSIPTPQTPYP